MKGRPSRGGQVRIVGGRLRGSRLPVADAEGLRPTPDRVRETLYNWLQPVIDGARVLDLFAGSGALGVEAASRGAARVTFVERDPRLAASLREQLQRLHVDAAKVESTDALRWLGGGAEPYDIVLLDPPFAADLWAPVAAALEQGGWLAPHAWIYVESPADRVPPLPPTWEPYRERRAGQVRLALYRRRPPVD